MKLSNVTDEHIKAYCGITDDDSGLYLLCADAAKAFIIAYTGLDEAEIDGYEDITLAYLIIVKDMYSNRDYAVDKTGINPTAAQILDSHRRNLV